MKYNILLLTIFCVSANIQGQWYFETGLNDSKFSEFVNTNGTKTTLHSYNGLRDFSHAVGYVFPFKSLLQRSEVEAHPSIFRVGVGVGFDQMNLRTQADFSGTKVPVHYNMAQVQGHLNLLFTPTIITKRPDALGFRRPAVNLLVEGGVSYNLYTNAVRSFTTNRGFITDLKEDNKFLDAYPAFSFGGGLEFPFNRCSTLYGKYVIENAFSTSNNTVNSTKEIYSTVKRRLVVGLRVDFRLKSKLREFQEKRITALETRDEREHDTVDLSPLYAKINALKEQLRAHEHEKTEKSKVNDGVFEVEQHDKGFMYLPDFKHVLFPLNSSELNVPVYGESLKNLVLFAKQNPQLKIKLIGYADGKTGSAETNIILSEQRAKSVYDYLIAHGIDATIVTFIGAGQTLQFSIDALAENRRTEIIILEK